MTSLLVVSNPACMEYEMSRIDRSIEKIAKIIEKYNDHPHAYEYYTAMQECLLALSDAMMKADNAQRMYAKAMNRIEIMENTLAKMVRKK